MMLTYASVPLMGFASVAVMGHLDDARYLAGVGLATNFFAFFYFLFAFIRWSSTGLSAQAKGRVLIGEGSDKLAFVILRGLSVGLGIGFVILLLRQPLGNAIFGLLTNNVELRTEAQLYSAGRMLGAPALLGTYALTGWFIGSGRPRAVMAMTIAANLANAGLLVLFVEGLGFRSFSAGIATSLAEWLGLAIGLTVALRTRGMRFVPLIPQAFRDAVAWRLLFTANLNILLKTTFTLVVFIGFLAVSGRMPPAVLAANLVLMQLFYLASYAFDGFSNACEAIAGQAVGAGRPELVRRTLVVALRCALATSALFALLYGLGGTEIVSLMTNLPEVRHEAVRYLPWLVLVPLTQAGATVMDGVFVGTLRLDHLRTSAILGAIGFVAVAIPAVAALANDGLWLAFAAYFVIRFGVAWLLFHAGQRRQSSG
jgi:MATE family multidrug resistance protein